VGVGSRDGVLVGIGVAVRVGVSVGLAVSVGGRARVAVGAFVAGAAETDPPGDKVGLDLPSVIGPVLRAREVVGVDVTASAVGGGGVADAAMNVDRASAQPANSTQVPSAINRSNSSDSLGYCCMGLLSS
jgi:hypothetical protein